MGGVRADEVPAHGRPWSLSLTLPPLAAVFLKHEPEAVSSQPSAVSEDGEAETPPKSQIFPEES
jgi:hypothetical protein